MTLSLSLEIHLLCLLHADTCPHEEDNNIKRLHTQPLFYHVRNIFYYAVKIFYCLHHVFTPLLLVCTVLLPLSSAFFSSYDGVSQQCSQAHRCVSLYSLFRTHERHIYILPFLNLQNSTSTRNTIAPGTKAKTTDVMTYSAGVISISVSSYSY